MPPPLRTEASSACIHEAFVAPQRPSATVSSMSASERYDMGKTLGGISMGKEIWAVMVEGFTDVVRLYADLITAPIMAVCRVLSDFIHNEGHYKRRSGSPRAH